MGNNANKKLVSVIMPVYNCQEFISQALNSVINQTYTNWEIIIVDDCSTDSTSKIIDHYIEKEPRVKYYRLEKNSGAAIARNKGTEISQGDYIAFLDSDDVWFPEKLTKQIQYMEENNFNFTCTSYTKIDEEGDFTGVLVNVKKKIDYDGILKISAGNSTVIYNKEKLGTIVIPNIKKRNDYVLFLKIIKKAGFMYGIEEPLSSHRLRVGSISHNKFSLVKYHWEVYRKYENLSVLKSIYLVVYWIFKAIFKFNITSMDYTNQVFDLPK